MKQGCKFIIVIFFIIYLSSQVYALGASPPSRIYNFEPGLEDEFTINVLKDTNKKIVLGVMGDLNESVTLDKTELADDEKSFSVKLKLPEELTEPGKHRTYILISEQPDPELSNFIETAITVKVVIMVYVPYPGRYFDAKLEARDVNVGEDVRFDLEIFSRGTEDVEVLPRIEVYDSKGLRIGELELQPRMILSQEEVKLKKFFNTEGLNPGDYSAKAFVEYGLTAEAETTFRLGSLSIDLVNYTNLFFIDDLEKFVLKIQSGWNDNIEGAYAEIFIYNDSFKSDSFRTSPVTLTPWQKRTVEGFFDSSEFAPGAYEANVTLYYFGGGEKASNSQVVTVFFQEPPDDGSLVWYYIGGGGILLFIIAIILKYFIINKNNGKKRRKK